MRRKYRTDHANANAQAQLKENWPRNVEQAWSRVRLTHSLLVNGFCALCFTLLASAPRILAK
jgi:hypothetical protein